MSQKGSETKKNSHRLVKTKASITPTDQLPPTHRMNGEKKQRRHHRPTQRNLSKQELIELHTKLMEQLQTRQTQFKALAQEKRKIIAEIKELQGDADYSEDEFDY